MIRVVPGRFGGLLPLLGLGACAGSHLPSAGNLLDRATFDPTPPSRHGLEEAPRRVVRAPVAPEARVFPLRPESPPPTAPPSRSPADEREFHIQRGTVDEVAGVVLGDILGVSYTLSPAVNGEISLETNGAISTEDLLQAFAFALSGVGADLVRLAPDSFAIVPHNSSPLPAQVVGLEDGRPPPLLPGSAVSVFVLRHVSAAQIAQMVTGLVRDSNEIRVFPDGNAFLVAGSETERRAVAEVVGRFDSAWVQGRTIAYYRLAHTPAAAMAGIVSRSIGPLPPGESGPTGISLLPLPHARALVAVADREDQQVIARTVREFDVAGASPGIRVRHLDHADPARVAQALGSVFGGASATIADPQQGGGTATAPAGPAAMAPQPAPRAAADDSFGRFELASYHEAPVIRAAAQAPAPRPPAADEGAGAEPQALPDGVGGQADGFDVPRFAALQGEGTLLYRVDDPDQAEAVEAAIDDLDRAPDQVMLRATIVEVRLTDELRYGVQAFLDAHGFRVSLGAARPGADGLASSLAASTGFQAAWTPSQSALILDALRNRTDVRVQSAPSVLVQDGAAATLMVGQAVPIETASAQSVLGSGAPIISQIEYRDTGVILRVVPRIGIDGRVGIRLDGEVSRVVPAPTTAAAFASPTIDQRRITTSMVGADGRTLVLGGLISDTSGHGRLRIPLLGDIPWLGDLFGSTSATGDRTELLILLTPTLVRDDAEAAAMSRDLLDATPLVREGWIGDRPAAVRGPRRLTPDPALWRQADYRTEVRPSRARRLWHRRPTEVRLAPTLAKLGRRVDDVLIDAPTREAPDPAPVPSEDRDAWIERAKRANVPEAWWHEMLGIE